MPRLDPPAARPVPGVVDDVVVGAGVIGAATAWQLARRGREVLLLDRFEAGHDRGASHGSTRMYRQTYADRSYLRLTVEAYPLWRELEAETGTALLHVGGGVDHGDPRRTGELAGALAAHGIAHHWLGPDEAAARWPGMAFEGPVLHQPDRSGRIDAERAVAALTAAAVAHGARVCRSTPVTALAVRSADLVELDTPSGAVRARRAVVAAGAWTADLLGGLIPLPPLRVTQEQPAHFRARDAAAGTAAADWPTFVHHTGPEQGWPGGVYGLPTGDGRVKAGFHGVGPEVHPDRRSFQPEPALLRRLQEYARTFLPGLEHTDPDPLSCTYTSTPDTGFVLDAVGPVVVGAGFSGHGFKFAPAVGRVLADLATGAIDRTSLAALR